MEILPGKRESRDVTQKHLEGFPDVAADILNVFIHGGRQTVRAESLHSAPTEADGRMVLRKAGYVGAVYREQYDGKVGDSFPVISLVLYWGKGHWKKARSIRELFRDRGLPPQVWKLADDYRLPVFELRNLPPEVRERFHSDMRHVVDYLAEGSGFRSNRPVVHKEALVRLLRALGGDMNVEDTARILEEMNVKEEDEITMCELFDQYTRQGRKEGIKEGLSEGLQKGLQALISTCRELGVSFDETAVRVREKFSLGEEEIRKNMQLYW